MTLHYHGTPITPGAVLEQLAGCHFCISYARPDQVERAHQIGQSVMLDNGAFTFWKRGERTDVGWWESYYAWAESWLAHPTTWAVIPDVIDGTEDENDALIEAWPFGDRGAPVWHMHESLDRLCRLDAEWQKVCIGSSAEFAQLGTQRWHERMEEAFNAVWCGHRGPEFVGDFHMLRGMAQVCGPYPFASVDSTDIARNHARPQNSARGMAERWDSIQTPGGWDFRQQLALAGAASGSPSDSGEGSDV